MDQARRASEFIRRKLCDEGARDYSLVRSDAIETTLLVTLLLDPTYTTHQMSKRAADKIRRQLQWFSADEEFKLLVPDALTRVHPK